MYKNHFSWGKARKLLAKKLFIFYFFSFKERFIKIRENIYFFKREQTSMGYGTNSPFYSLQ
jgi:hypothetical protein